MKSAMRVILCSVLLLTTAIGLAGGIVRAQTPVQGELTVTTQYPIVKGTPGSTFSFEVSLTWLSASAQNFNLSMTTPAQWSSRITRDSPPSEVAAIRMEANQDVGQRFNISLFTSSSQLPKPGEYIATLNVVSDDGAIKKTIDFKAVVTAKYSFTMDTPTGGTFMQALAGKDNMVVIQLYNNGTEEVNNIALEAASPEGWEVIFDPGGVSNLAVGGTQNIIVNVKPPQGTVAGDYIVTLSSLSIDFEPQPLKIRVGVVVTSILRWVIIGVIALAIIAFGVLFWLMSRRHTD
jgi:uncharacterized membrane protein